MAERGRKWAEREGGKTAKREGGQWAERGRKVGREREGGKWAEREGGGGGGATTVLKPQVNRRVYRSFADELIKCLLTFRPSTKFIASRRRYFPSRLDPRTAGRESLPVRVSRRKHIGLAAIVTSLFRVLCASAGSVCIRVSVRRRRSGRDQSSSCRRRNIKDVFASNCAKRWRVCVKGDV